MQDSRLLSGFHEQHEEHERPMRAPGGVVMFDACRSGAVLRTVLFVELVIAVAAMYGATGLAPWLAQLAFVTGAALPAALLWLLSICLLKTWLGRLNLAVQCGLGVLLGALAGAAGCGFLRLSGLLVSAPWWAAAGSGALLAGVLVTMLVLRARGATPASTAARLAELQARIRPHFLFNTLNSAIALVRKEPARAEALLEDLSDLFRHALVEQREAVTLAQEIELAQRYLAIEKVRFGERLQLSWSIDERANGAKLPPLLLQPLLENAVKHGVEPSEQGAEVRISTERRRATVVIKVTNTVPAGQGLRGSGLALDNVRDRLGLLHDLEGQFRSGLKNGLFQVRIEVPA
jgi:two-component system sensor histidine kinase AlgZ